MPEVPQQEAGAATFSICSFREGSGGRRAIHGSVRQLRRPARAWLMLAAGYGLKRPADLVLSTILYPIEKMVCIRA